MSTYPTVKEEKWHRAEVFHNMAQQSGNGRFGLQNLFSMIVEQVAALMGSKQSSLLLLQADKASMQLMAGQQPHTVQPGAIIDLQKGIVGEVYGKKRPFMTQNYDEWNGRLSLPSLTPTSRMLGVPIRAGDDCIGILTAQDNVVGDFSDAAIEELTLFAAQTAVLIENAQLHERLQQNKERLQHIITAAPDAIFICDASQKIVQVNTVACTLFGYSEAELIGQDVSMLLPPNRRAGHAAYMRRFEYGTESVRPMRPVHGQAYGSTANGRLIPIDTTISKTAISGTKYYTAIVRDVTERLKLEHEMQLSQKMESLGLVASGVAHDFNNLLNAIAAQNELAKLNLPPDSPVRLHLNNSTKIVHQATAITEQLLSYAGDEQYATASLSFNDLLRENVAFLNASLPSSIELQLMLTTAPTEIKAEAGQIQQVVMNLIINAADAYAGKRGLITIKTERIYLDGSRKFPEMRQPLDAGWYITLDVMDSGCGIPSDVRNKIFDPFFTTKETGRGLGLAAVRGIVQGHDGHIWLDSTVGDGTTFHLLFPVAEEVKEVVAIEDKRPFTNDDTPTILLVEDEKTVREAMAQFLEMSEFVVLTAENGRLAIDLYQKQPDLFSLIILDLSLPVLHGRHVLAHVRQTNPDLPIILLSGYSKQAALEGISNLTNCIFIKKPFNIHQLVEKSREMLGI